MIILDTNVVSEMMKPNPNAAVHDWLNEQMAKTLYLSCLTLAELLFGIEALPAGKRKNALAKMVEDLIELFKNRILPFDVSSAHCYAKLASVAQKNGRGFPVPDAYIAAIAASHNYAVASRDIAAFEAAGILVINPWEV